MRGFEDAYTSAYQPPRASGAHPSRKKRCRGLQAVELGQLGGVANHGRAAPSARVCTTAARSWPRGPSGAKPNTASPPYGGFAPARPSSRLLTVRPSSAARAVPVPKLHGWVAPSLEQQT